MAAATNKYLNDEAELKKMATDYYNHKVEEYNKSK
jgi:hypothetical protein